MPGREPIVVYWDACVFISLFTGGQDRTTDELAGIRYWAEMADSRQAVIVTSTLTYAEVLESLSPNIQGLSPAQYRDFDAFIIGRVALVDVHTGVIRMTKQIRERNRGIPQLPGQEHRLCTPDAIHLATAALEQCTEFHTFDYNNNNRCTGLLRLDVHASAMGLFFRIKKPEAPPPPPAEPSLFQDMTS
jgi:predicted nucleic acid-binding protein